MSLFLPIPSRYSSETIGIFVFPILAPLQRLHSHRSKSKSFATKNCLRFFSSIFGKGCKLNRTRHQKLTEILAENAQSQRSDVSERIGRDFGCHRTGRISKSHGTAVPTNIKVCVKPAFPSGRTSAVLLEQRVHYVVDTREFTGYIADYDAVTVSEFDNTLEQDDTRIDIQRAEVIYGIESHVVQRVHQQFQRGTANVSAKCIRAFVYVTQYKSCAPSDDDAIVVDC